jgi:hypothetical protein
MMTTRCERDAVKATVLSALVLAALAAAAPAALAQGDAPATVLHFTEVDSLLAPGQGAIAGLAWIGPDTLAVLDDVPDSLSASGQRETWLVLMDRTGAELRREDFSGVLRRGLAWDGEFLYGCGDADDGSSIIYRIEPDTMSVDGAFNTAGHKPTGMCFDGRFVWITDRDSGRVDRFDPEVDEITRSALTPGFTPCGLAWDGRNMWVSDSGTGSLYRLSGSRRTWSATVSPDAFMHRGRDVLLAHDGVHLWYLLAGERTLRMVQFE